MSSLGAPDLYTSQYDQLCRMCCYLRRDGLSVYIARILLSSNNFLWPFNTVSNKSIKKSKLT